MVDALRDAHRVLVPGGTVLDLRPRAEMRPIDAVVADGQVNVGELTVDAVDDDAAADAAIGRAVDEAWFTLVTRQQFQIQFYWDNVADLATYAAGGRPKTIRPGCGEIERVYRHLGAVRLRCERTLTFGAYRQAPLR